MVFAHPNHEFAVFGMVQRIRPFLIYLTDGGSQQRVAETRNALKQIDLLENAFSLNYPEEVLYDALLDSNVELFLEIANHVRALLTYIRPAEVLCDAVEFYNPLHDITLPIVNKALTDNTDNIEIYEVPLVYQVQSNKERYICQRFPEQEEVNKIQFSLSDEEISMKLHMRDENYNSLRNQMGGIITNLTEKFLSVEEIGRARSPLLKLDGHRCLRYEWRGKLLKKNKSVRNVITYHEHYLPVARLLGCN